MVCFSLSEVFWIWIFICSIEFVKSNCWIFFQLSPAICWWWIYSFPVIFIHKRFNFWYSFQMLPSLAFVIIIDRISCFFVFIQSRESAHDLPRFWYFVTFVLEWMKTTRDRIPNFYWYFQPNLISRKNWFKKFFNNFICFIINHDFYFITLWMHYMPFEEILLTAIVNWILHVSDFLRLFVF